MRKKHFTEEQIAFALRQAEAGTSVAEVICHGRPLGDARTKTPAAGAPEAAAPAQAAITIAMPNRTTAMQPTPSSRAAMRQGASARWVTRPPATVRTDRIAGISSSGQVK